MKKYKVYNGCFFYKGVQVRGFMYGTQKQIAEATHTSLSYIRNYWSETGNTESIKAATENSGKLLWLPIRHYNAKASDYKIAES